jgi:hypothetical protein
MKAVRRRILLKALLVGSLIVMQAGGVAAQIVDQTQTTEPQPIDAVEGPGGPDQAPTPEPTPELVPQPIEEVAPTVEPAPEVVVAPEEPNAELPLPIEVVEAVIEEINKDAGVAEGTGTTSTGGEPSVPGTVAETPSVVGTIEASAPAAQNEEASTSIETSVAQANPELVAAIASVVSDVEETIEETAGPEVLPGGASTADREGGTKSFSKAQTTVALQNWAQGGEGILSSAGSIFGSAQPSFAILVDAMNDADGDGNFTDVEIASGPSVDVRFRALISNIGSTSFEIAGVNHTYEAVSGRAQVEVCETLVGLVLPAGKSVPCAFSLAEYAPPRGESAVNTITAAAFEIGNSGRGASDSDTSTVDTLFAGEVLAVAVKREPGLLAFTGMDAAGLIVLALGLLLAGATLSYVGRERRVAQEAALIGGDPWVGLLQWVRAELAESRARQMVGSR